MPLLFVAPNHYFGTTCRINSHRSNIIALTFLPLPFHTNRRLIELDSGFPPWLLFIAVLATSRRGRPSQRINQAMLGRQYGSIRNLGIPAIELSALYDPQPQRFASVQVSIRAFCITDEIYQYLYWQVEVWFLRIRSLYLRLNLTEILAIRCN